MYAALKGNDATVRYVVLPNEPHGYRALELTEETLWQMTDWLDRYLQPGRTATGLRERVCHYFRMGYTNSVARAEEARSISYIPVARLSHPFVNFVTFRSDRACSGANAPHFRQLRQLSAG